MAYTYLTSSHNKTHVIIRENIFDVKANVTIKTATLEYLKINAHPEALIFQRQNNI